MGTDHLSGVHKPRATYFVDTDPSSEFTMPRKRPFERGLIAHVKATYVSTGTRGKLKMDGREYFSHSVV